jgi:carbon storage regulator
MLVLSRKIGETIRIGEEIDLVVLDVSRGRVKLGFAGPRNVQVRRGELSDAPRTEEENAGAAAVPPRVCADSSAGPPLRSFRQAAAGV